MRNLILPDKFKRVSVLSLIVANTIPLGGVLFFDWNLFQIIFLYWLESGVIGFYNIFKIIKISGYLSILFVPAFIFHYGVFMLVHLVFIFSIFTPVLTYSSFFPSFKLIEPYLNNISISIIGLLISHGASFFSNFIGNQESKRTNIVKQMGAPYSRIIVMHLTLIFSGWLILIFKEPILGLVLLVLLKIVIDITFHLREHAAEKPIEAPQSHSSLFPVGAGFLLVFFIIIGIYSRNIQNVKTNLSAPTIIPTVSQTNKLINFADTNMGISFQYTSNWKPKFNNIIQKSDLCDLHSIIPSSYPTPGVNFAECQASKATPVTSITYSNYLELYLESTDNGTKSATQNIRLSYYENPENLSIQQFNSKYLSEGIGGDSISIWSPDYEKVRNSGGIDGYYDKNHYCVARCRIYVWAGQNKIFILRYSFVDLSTQEQIEVFQKIFSTFKFLK